MEVVDDEDDDAAGGVVGRARRRQNDAFANRRRRRHLRGVGAAAMNQHERRELLLDAVFVELEIVLGEIGLELPAPVPDDDVGADQVDRGRGRSAFGPSAPARAAAAALRVRRRLNSARSPATIQGANFSLFHRASSIPGSVALHGTSCDRYHGGIQVRFRRARSFGSVLPPSGCRAARRRRRRRPLAGTAAGVAVPARRADRESSARIVEPLSHLLLGDPGVGIQRLGLRAQLLDARGVSAALGDARLQLGVSRAQASELLAADDRCSTGIAGGRRSSASGA